MANRPSSSRPGSGRGNAPSGGGRRRPPPPVKKPFPWGVVAVATVLGLLLAGILVYAITNQGAGFVDPLKRADSSVPGVQKIGKLDRGHVDTAVTYAQSPPVGGKHNPVWENCGVYTSPIANEHAVHSLEHGAAWLTYRPDLPAAQVSILKAKVAGRPFRLMSPYPGLKTVVSLQAWGRQLFVDSVSDKRIDAFLSAYAQGPQAPERGTCDGGTSATGPLPPASPATPASSAPSPATSAAPSPAGSAAASPGPSPSK